MCNIVFIKGSGTSLGQYNISVALFKMTQCVTWICKTHVRTSTLEEQLQVQV